jgi:hypothetical protein
MINNRDMFIAEIAYILSKESNLSNNAIRDIICIADVLHHIYYGRTISGLFIKNKNYKFDIKLLNKILKDKKKILEMDYFFVSSCLSDSDKCFIGFAIDRYEVEPIEFFYKIEKQ